MAYNNIYDWHDSLQKELEKDRRVWERQSRYHEAMAGRWVYGKRRVNGKAYISKFNRHDWLKAIEGAKERMKNMKTVCKENPNLGSWKTGYDVKSDPNDNPRKKWGYSFKFNREDWLKDIEDTKKRIRNMKTVCEENPKWGSWKTDYDVKPDPNDITDLCKVEIIN